MFDLINNRHIIEDDSYELRERIMPPTQYINIINYNND